MASWPSLSTRSGLAVTSTTTALAATSFVGLGMNSSGITRATSMETRPVWKAGPDLTATQLYVDKGAALNMDHVRSQGDASVYMAGRASTVTSASPTLAVYMAPV